MNTSCDEIMNNVLSATVQFPQYKRAIDQFEWILNFTETYGKASGLMLVGPTGAGKTKLAEKMAASHCPVEEVERTHIKVLYFSMPAMPTLSSICKALLDKLGQMYKQKATEGDLSLQLKTLLKRIGTLVLIIDEAQHLVDGSKSNKHIATIADWLKQLINDANISIILFGIPTVEKLFIHNSQLRRRFDKFEINEFSSKTKKDFNLYAGVVAKLISESGYSGETDYLCLPSSLEMLHYATNGRIAYIAKLLAYALKIATEKQSAVLTKEHLYEAFDRAIWPGSSDLENPFSGKFSPRQLNRVGEPFYEEVV